MEISGGFNNPVNMYKTSAENNLNLAIEGENKIYPQNNIFSSGLVKNESAKASTPLKRKKRKSKRLNTTDTEFFLDEVPESTNEQDLNFFVNTAINPYKEKFKKVMEFFKSIPLINYFHLKHKGQNIKKAVEELNDIVQNADELITTTVPFGENNKVYGNITQNLTNAAIVIGKANKEIES